MEVLTFNVDKDRRNLTNDVQNFDMDFKNSPSWVQARQYENQLRQVQVNVQHGDGTPFDLTGANPVLEGFMPDGVHRIIDAKHGVMIDPVNGQFRFDFPAPVFAVSGSYKQIFFRLYRAGKNIATLEFSMEVLADKVISGLIPADYVTPIEDIMDKAETVFNNAAGDIDAIKKAWAAKLQDLFDSLSKTGKDTADALMQVQAGLTTLEAQIKSDGLVKQIDLDKLSDMLNVRMNAVEHKDIFNYRNKLQYKTVSATIYTKDETVTDEMLTRINATGADLTLVTMVTVDNANDSSPTDISVTTFNDLIDRANKIGLKIGMIKPHIGIAGQHDSFSRKDYLPDNPDGFFENWKDLMLHYAELAKNNGVPILCIGCEMFNQTDVKYLTKWQDIYNTIKAKYPDLLITYAMSQYEFFEPENQGQIASVVDYIGMNIYPSYISSEYKSGLKVSELEGAWWNDWNGNQFMETLDEYFYEYQKPIFVTETGLMPYRDGLAHLISSYINTDGNENYDAQAIGYKAALEAIAKDSHIIGVAIWHASKPFSFISKDVNTVTPSEKVLTQYFKGGKI